MLVLMTSVCLLSGCGKNHDFNIIEKYPMGMSKADFLEKAGKEFKEKDIVYIGDEVGEELTML